MDKQSQRSMIEVFGKLKSVEKIRTEILFVRPYGNIMVPDIPLGPGLYLCAARIGDDRFFEDGYWANWGPKLSDDDPDVFIVPVALKPYAVGVCVNWARVIYGDFVTTESGAIVLDVPNVSAWEGYVRPGKRDANFDRQRLETSAMILKSMCGKE